jgi:hypothetical protein
MNTPQEFNDQHQLDPSTGANAIDPDLKRRAMYYLREAERAMHTYACSCELGEERNKAFDVYENIRTATQVR